MLILIAQRLQCDDMQTHHMSEIPDLAISRLHSSGLCISHLYICAMLPKAASFTSLTMRLAQSSTHAQACPAWTTAPAAGCRRCHPRSLLARPASMHSAGLLAASYLLQCLSMTAWPLDRLQ